MNDFEKNNFADFTASSAMKDIGFDENCMAYYNGPQFLNCENIQDVKLSHNNMFARAHDDISAPLHQQARKWFREKHNLFIEVRFMKYSEECFYLIFDKNWGKGETLRGGNFSAEPEAYNAAIIKAAKIVKEKQNG